jgi:hypothetical protein
VRVIIRNRQPAGKLRMVLPRSRRFSRVFDGSDPMITLDACTVQTDSVTEMKADVCDVLPEIWLMSSATEFGCPISLHFAGKNRLDEVGSDDRPRRSSCRRG